MRADEKYHGVVLGPVVTEKSNLLGNGELRSGNYLVFRVAPEATKKDVRRALTKLFGVDVVKVQVLNRAGKQGRAVGVGKRALHRSSRRAFVRLAEGQDIDFASHFGE